MEGGRDLFHQYSLRQVVENSCKVPVGDTWHMVGTV